MLLLVQLAGFRRHPTVKVLEFSLHSQGLVLGSPYIAAPCQRSQWRYRPDLGVGSLALYPAVPVPSHANRRR